MNVLLLYPQFPDTFWSFRYALRFISKEASLPPLGLLTVAAMLPSDWNKRLVDCNVRSLREADLRWADLVFISAMTVQRNHAQQLISHCKNAGLTVVAGGPLFTTEYEKFHRVDHFVLNEAELTLPLFLEDFKKGQADHVYTSGEYADLHETPVPSWELLDLKRYVSMSIQYSRGCPFDCDFCNVTALFGHRPRVKKAGQVVAELQHLYALGWTGPVFFVDDNLIGNKRHFKNELLPALLEWKRDKVGMGFNTQASINIADDAVLMEQMVKAGFNAVFIGIETPAEEGLAECSKTQNLRRNLIEDVRRIQHAGLEVQGGFIVGFDSDDTSIFDRQFAFIQQSGIVTAMVGMLIALPSTRLYNRMKTEGRLIGQVSGDNADGSTNIIPQMGMETLKERYRALMNHIYAPEAYYERVKTFLLEFHPLKATGARISFQHILALLRSMVHLGIFAKERLHFWRLISWTLRNRPELFSIAIRCAIYGYHFRKTSELIPT